MKIILSLVELPLACGLGFAVFVLTFWAGCAWMRCVDSSGMLWLVIGIPLGIVAAGVYWIVAMRMGVARLRRRLILDGLVLVAAIAAYVLPQIEWRQGMTSPTRPPAAPMQHDNAPRISK